MVGMNPTFALVVMYLNLGPFFVRNQLPLHSLQKGPLIPHRSSRLARNKRLNWIHGILKGST